jgi:hypothetical protein
MRTKEVEFLRENPVVVATKVDPEVVGHPIEREEDELFITIFTL